MPDRHYEESAGVSLADHLEAVHANLRRLLSPDGLDAYFDELRQALLFGGFDLPTTTELLGLVALLHDLGKVRDDKDKEGEHPLTGKSVKLRHPVVSLIAALELLPEAQAGRNTILALVEEHDTPYSWYLQFRRSGQVPKRKSWARLDRRIDPREDGTGIVILSVFKLADIDGHECVGDVLWFIEQANTTYLREKGRWVPVPSQNDIRRLAQKDS